MDNREATEKFKLSKKLFAEGRYQDALVVVNQLDAAFPGQKNILYPKALSLAKLKRYDDAKAIAEELVKRFGDHRAGKLLQRLAAKLEGAPDLDPTMLLDRGLDDFEAPEGQVGDPLGLDHLFDPKPPSVPQGPPPKDKSGSSKTIWYVALGAVFVLLITVGAAWLITRGSEEASPQETPAPQSGAPAGGQPTAAQSASTQTARIQWYQNYDQGMTAYTNSDRPALLFFYSQSSEDSRRMETEVFAEPSIVQLLSNYECIRIDFDADPQARTDQDVTTAPTVIILDPFWGFPDYNASGYVSARDLYDVLMDLDYQSVPNFDIPVWATALVFVLSILIVPWPLFFALGLVHKLPKETFGDNIVHVGLVAIGTDVVAGFFPCIGLFVKIYILHNVYDMGFTDFLIYFFFQIIAVVFLFGVAILIFGAGIFHQLAAL